MEYVYLGQYTLETLASWKLFQDYFELRRQNASVTGLYLDCINETIERTGESCLEPVVAAVDETLVEMIWSTPVI